MVELSGLYVGHLDERSNTRYLICGRHYVLHAFTLGKQFMDKASLEDSPLISQKHTQGKHLFRRWPTPAFPYQDFEAQLDVFKRVPGN